MVSNTDVYSRGGFQIRPPAIFTKNDTGAEMDSAPTTHLTPDNQEFTEYESEYC